MRRLLPLFAVLALVAGCGDEDDEMGRTVTVNAEAPIPVTADEYSFDPETIVVSGGRRLTFELTNDGSLAHNLRVFDGDDELGGTESFPGGETRAATLDLEPGEYRLVCTVGDHEDLGMTGKLEVR